MPHVIVCTAQFNWSFIILCCAHKHMCDYLATISFHWLFELNNLLLHSVSTSSKVSLSVRTLLLLLFCMIILVGIRATAIRNTQTHIRHSHTHRRFKNDVFAKWWNKFVGKITPHIVCSNPYVWTQNNILRACVRANTNEWKCKGIQLLFHPFSWCLSIILLLCAGFFECHIYYSLFAVIILCSSTPTPTPTAIVEERMCDVFNMSIKILIFLLLLLLHMQILKDTFLGISFFGIIWIFF